MQTKMLKLYIRVYVYIYIAKGHKFDARNYGNLVCDLTGTIFWAIQLCPQPSSAHP